MIDATLIRHQENAVAPKSHFCGRVPGHIFLHSRAYVYLESSHIAKCQVPHTYATKTT